MEDKSVGATDDETVSWMAVMMESIEGEMKAVTTGLS